MVNNFKVDVPFPFEVKNIGRFSSGIYECEVWFKGISIYGVDEYNQPRRISVRATTDSMFKKRIKNKVFADIKNVLISYYTNMGYEPIKKVRRPRVAKDISAMSRNAFVNYFNVKGYGRDNEGYYRSEIEGNSFRYTLGNRSIRTERLTEAGWMIVDEGRYESYYIDGGVVKKREEIEQPITIFKREDQVIPTVPEQPLVRQKIEPIAKEPSKQRVIQEIVKRTGQSDLEHLMNVLKNRKNTYGEVWKYDRAYPPINNMNWIFTLSNGEINITTNMLFSKGFLPLQRKIKGFKINNYRGDILNSLKEERTGFVQIFSDSTVEYDKKYILLGMSLLKGKITIKYSTINNKEKVLFLISNNANSKFTVMIPPKLYKT